jgi:hypothetical protein
MQKMWQTIRLPTPFSDLFAQVSGRTARIEHTRTFIGFNTETETRFNPSGRELGFRLSVAG